MSRKNLHSSPLKYQKSTHSDEVNPRDQVVHMFVQMQLKGAAVRILRSLTKKPVKLMDLKTYNKSTSTTNRHHEGIMSVSVDNILGSEGRANDFDSNFTPLHRYLRNRWLNVAAAHLAGKPLPPVELIQVGEIYFVRDGHHRISVAKAFGQKDIDAEVTKWEIQPQIKMSNISRNESIRREVGYA